jgi:uncharacterized membrane-anchored protein
MSNIKPNLYVSIPFLCALIGGFYEWTIKYFLEPKSGTDDSETAKWIFVAVIAYGIFGFWIGVIIDLFIWLIAIVNRKVNK